VLTAWVCHVHSRRPTIQESEVLASIATSCCVNESSLQHGIVLSRNWAEHRDMEDLPACADLHVHWSVGSQLWSPGSARCWGRTSAKYHGDNHAHTHNNSIQRRAARQQSRANVSSSQYKVASSTLIRYVDWQITVQSIHKRHRRLTVMSAAMQTCSLRPIIVSLSEQWMPVYTVLPPCCRPTTHGQVTRKYLGLLQTTDNYTNSARSDEFLIVLKLRFTNCRHICDAEPAVSYQWSPSINTLCVLSVNDYLHCSTTVLWLTSQAQETDRLNFVELRLISFLHYTGDVMEKYQSINQFICS